EVVGVGMGVDFGGRAVGGPAGVGHSDFGGRKGTVAVKGVFQDADSPDGAADMQAAVIVDDRNAGGVVAAVLEALEAFNEHRLSDFATDVSDDSAHSFVLYPGSSVCRRLSVQQRSKNEAKRIGTALRTSAIKTVEFGA